jgi:hypothetical protein
MGLFTRSPSHSESAEVIHIFEGPWKNHNPTERLRETERGIRPRSRCGSPDPGKEEWYVLTSFMA